jgi:hypothetical protein
MDATKGNIYAILNGNKQFLIPVYQRYYSWDLAQCQRLWKDIVDMQKKNKMGHFVGSIVNIAEQAMPTGVQKYMIIDGQQRITTLTLLLIALRDYAESHPEGQGINAKRINNTLLKNEYEEGDDRYKLLLTETDRDILVALIEKKPIKVNTNSRLLMNLKFFADQIEKLEIKPKEVYESIGKLQIVNITLDRAVDDAQAIFESLNSTGKELTESDLIRNYVLMGLEPSEQRYVYEHQWRPMELLFNYEKQESTMDKFFRDYLTMKLARIPKQDQVYEEFKGYHLNCEFGSVRELCQDLLEYAEFYTNMIFARSTDLALRNLYADISELRMEVAYPFLLKVHRDNASGLISDDSLKEVLSMCISYVLRRNICEIPTNSLNKTFATFKNSVRNDDYMNSVRAYFVLLQTYKEFPDDEKFAAAFVTRDIYNMRQRNFILRHLEEHENKVAINIENFTIEHIMPQNSKMSAEWQAELGSDWKEIQKKYLHTIGNLTLTAYNSEMSDHSFMEKMDMDGGFKQSALRLNKYVVMQTEWKEAQIQERAKHLAAKATKIWKYPTISKASLASYQIEEKPATTYSVDSYDFNLHTKSLFELIDKRIMNLGTDVKREFKKLYIAYKLDTNFVDIVVQKSQLRVSVNMRYAEVYDPKNICKDITGLGRWGNGDVELFFGHTSDIEDVMEIIKQSYNAQSDE